MLRRCSDVEAQWLVRIILRDMRIGGEACGRDTERAEWLRLVMEAFRPRLYSFYLRQRDLPAAAEKAERARRADAAARGRSCGHGRAGLRRRHTAAAAPGGGPARRMRSARPRAPRALRAAWRLRECHAQPCPSADAPANFGEEEELLLETKHDGERIQPHLWRDPGPTSRSPRLGLA